MDESADGAREYRKARFLTMVSAMLAGRWRPSLVEADGDEQAYNDIVESKSARVRI